MPIQIPIILDSSDLKKSEEQKGSNLKNHEICVSGMNRYTTRPRACSAVPEDVQSNVLFLETLDATLMNHQN